MLYYDSKKTFPRSPGRGSAAYMDQTSWIRCGDGQTFVPTEDKFNLHGMYTPMYLLSAFSSGNDYQLPGRERREGAVGGENKDIDDQTLEAIDTALALIKKKGAIAMPRFAYDCRGRVGCEPDSVEVILRHIEQLSAVLNKYAGTVISIEAGTLGPWGEMWGNKYFPVIPGDEDQPSNRILGKWLECLDESITVKVRQMPFVLAYTGLNQYNFLENLPFEKGSKGYRFGLYNDGYLYDGQDCGTWTPEGEEPERENLYRSKGIEFLKSNAARIPYGGELAYARSEEALHSAGSPIYSKGFVKELYDTHLCYLRNIEHYPHQVTAQALCNQPFTDYYKFDDMPDVSEYYGENLNKFMLDHMGYRFVARDLETKCEGEKACFKIEVENTGFAGIMFKTYSEVIVKAPDGSLEKAAVFSGIEDIASKEKAVLSCEFDVPSKGAGEYKIYLRFSTIPFENCTEALSGAIALANPDVFDEEIGANLIMTIEK